MYVCTQRKLTMADERLKQQQDQVCAVNLWLALWHFVAAFAAFAATFSSRRSWSTPVVFLYNNWKKIGNTTQFLIVPEVKTVATWYPGYWLPWCSIFSGLHHFLAAYCYRTFYEGQVNRGFNPLRWLDYALSAPLMTVVNCALFYSPPDVNTLLLTGFVMGLIIAIGAMIEYLWTIERLQAVSTVCLAGACVAFAVLWGTPIAQLRTADQTNVPHFVYIFLGLLAGSFSLFPLIFIQKVRGSNVSVRRNYDYELWYGLLSAVSKIPLLLFYVVSITIRDGMAAVQMSNSTSLPDSAPSNTDAQIGLGVGLGAVAFVAGAIVWYVGSERRSSMWKSYWQHGDVVTQYHMALL